MSVAPEGRPLLPRGVAIALIAVLVAGGAAVAAWALTRDGSPKAEPLTTAATSVSTGTEQQATDETTSSTETAAPDPATGPVVRALTLVPAATLATVGTGTGRPLIRVREKVPIAKVGGKPVVIYIGAEFCPYCAAQRWALVNALARFGTFIGIGLALSSPDDVYPSTSTLTFRKARFTSRYLAFQSVETETTFRQPLETPSEHQARLWDTFTTAPYGPPHAPRRAIPLTYIAGRYFTVGAQFGTNAIAGQSHLQIARQLANPGSDVSKNVIGAANRITSAICAVTGNQPASACTSAIAKIPPGV